MHAILREEIEAALGEPITGAERVAGGDIHDAFRVTLGGGRVVFAKGSARAPAGMFDAEARGLAWLAEPDVLRTPRVLAVGRHVLVLEWLDDTRRAADFDAQLGRGLAALHAASPGSFGLDHDNYIGRLPQPNAAEPGASWADFYRRARLEPMIARSSSLLAPLRPRLDALLDRLPALVGPEEPPARLHGDLWGGNLHAAEGAPALIDPACYGGHREMDLAMMKLFGGFSARVFETYAEAAPLAPGVEERVPLYQLYPLLVHVGLFGAGYVGSVERVLGRYE